MVLYRKYRPQKLTELDLKEVRENLAKTLLSSYRPHAYLFSGPKGTGKTSAARIVAKILNCLNNSGGGEPCNKCESCIAITEGRHMDVLEIDAASNRGIDEIRDLREKIKLTPLSAKYKVYIIDEVHMLTNDAFNALLKTLEEPPAHAVFILATTDPDKLPETIHSRSTKFAFKKATTDEILHALGRVITGEKIKIDPEALELVSKQADGSFRDATKHLEATLNQGFTKYEDVLRMFGFGKITPADFLILLKKGEIKPLLETIVAMGQNGADFRIFITGILNELHKLILHKYEIKTEASDDNLIKMLDVSEINGLLKLFSQVYSDLKFASRPELPMETAVIEWSSQNK